MLEQVLVLEELLILFLELARELENPASLLVEFHQILLVVRLATAAVEDEV